MDEEPLASEALFAFVGWLTTRQERVCFSARDNSAVAADLIHEFCATQRLSPPRDGWVDRFVSMEGK